MAWATELNSHDNESTCTLAPFREAHGGTDVVLQSALSSSRLATRSPMCFKPGYPCELLTFGHVTQVQPQPAFKCHIPSGTTTAVCDQREVPLTGINADVSV